jgi:hypothetical protein
VDLNFDLPSLNLGNHTQMKASLLAGQAWGLSDGARGVLDGRVGLTRRLGPRDFVTLNYNYSSTPAGIDPSPFSVGRQRVTLNGHTEVRRCRVKFNLTEELDGDRAFGSLYLTRPLSSVTNELGRPIWSLEVRHFFSRLTSYSVSGSRFSLTRLLGRYRVSLCYSPQGSGIYESRPWIDVYGYGYTYSGGRKLWIELSAANF